MRTFKPGEQFIKLCDAVLDERASSAEITQLEELVLSSRDYLRYYTQRANEHAGLLVLMDEMSHDKEKDTELQYINKQVQFKPYEVYKYISTLALGLCVGLVIWWINHSSSTFAIISSMKNVKCVNSDFPINLRARLGERRLKIETGILTLQFDSRAEMVIEGPADIELLDSLNCTVYEGRVITSMPKGESGFIVRTAYANFHDLGTKFGVCVSKHGVAVLEVFDGQVDANHLSTGNITRINQSERFISSINKFSKELEKEDVAESLMNPSVSKTIKPVIRITTNNGTGKDKTLVRDPNVLIRKNNIFNYPDYLLILKNCIDEGGGWDRKAYLKFDMEYLKGQKVQSAMLKLNLVNSEIGYSSRCPDSTFAIYGIHEEFETWPDDLCWGNAPGASDDVNSVNLSQAVLLGKFTVPQGIVEGVFSIKTPELIDFINQDHNQSVSMVMVRETQESEVGGIAHCFAGGQAIDGNPPTLLLEIEE